MFFCSIDLMKKTKRHQIKPVETQPSVGDFDSLQLNSTVIEQPLPILPKAPETTELVSVYSSKKILL